MAYRKMDAEDLYEFYRRFLKGQSPGEIGKGMNTDPKTVRKYLKLMNEAGLARENPVLNRLDGLSICQRLLPQIERKSEAQDALARYEEYFRELIHDPLEPMKPKTAFQVVKEKFGVQISYESFKRFVRRRGLRKTKDKKIIRIELPPGREVQIDYGKVGRIYDPMTKRNRVVYAFVGVLSYSRYPFIKFVLKQDQVSFANCVIEMFEFYGGAVEFISIDNLKAGVITPHLYEPKLNRSLADAMNYYGVFINPCRVATPTDKGKVERMIPVARELYLRFKNIIENPTLDAINIRSIQWSREEYGLKPHGTTQVPPVYAFIEIEKPALRALPDERFVIPLWKMAKVHPDQFIQFENKRYSLPAEYRGIELWVCKTGPVLRVFHAYKLIREYVISGKVIHCTDADFPEDKKKMVDSWFPRKLIMEAGAICKEAGGYIEDVLLPHAYLNTRRAQGLLSVLKKNSGNHKIASICIRAKYLKIVNPKKLTALFEVESRQLEMEEVIPMSDEGRAMIRPGEYYTGDNSTGENNGDETPIRTELTAIASAGYTGEPGSSLAGG